MKGVRIGVLLGAVLASSPVLAAHGGSMEDQIACTPDVYRLCSSFIPDEDAITACLQKNRIALSPACQKVFSRPSGGSAGATQNDDD